MKIALKVFSVIAFAVLAEKGYSVDALKERDVYEENDIISPELTDRKEITHWPNGRPRLVTFEYGTTRRSVWLYDNGNVGAVFIRLGPNDQTFYYSIHLNDGVMERMSLYYTDYDKNEEYKRNIQWLPENTLDFTYIQKSGKKDGLCWQRHKGRIIEYACYRNGKVVETLRGEYVPPAPPPWKIWPDGRITKTEIVANTKEERIVQVSPEELKRYMMNIVGEF